MKNHSQIAQNPKILYNPTNTELSFLWNTCFDAGGNSCGKHFLTEDFLVIGRNGTNFAI